MYAFLELNPSNYSKWCKTNITENRFATENEDYIRFVLEYESAVGIKKREDFKLTSKFARKLSMTQKNHKGEIARDYFTTLEDKIKEEVVNRSQASPLLQSVAGIIDSLIKQEAEQNRLKKQQEKIEKKLDVVVTW